MSAHCPKTIRNSRQNSHSKTSGRSRRIGDLRRDTGPCISAPRTAFLRRNPAPFSPPAAKSSRQNQTELTTERAVDDEVDGASDGDHNVPENGDETPDDGQPLVSRKDFVHGRERVGRHGERICGNGNENDDDADGGDGALVRDVGRR